MRTRLTVVAFLALVATALYVEATRAGGSLAAAAQTPASGSIACSLTGYKASAGLTAAVAAEALTVTWDGDKNQELRLRFTINGGTPTIQELAVRHKGGTWAALATNVTPEFRVVTAKRRMEGGPLTSLGRLGMVKLGPVGPDRFKDVPQEVMDKHKWDAFWDAPLYLDDKNMNRVVGMPRRPDDVKRATATYQARSCDVKTDGARLMVTFPGVSLGLFAGELQFTVFKGSNLIEQEVMAKTDQDNVAYLYNAGLKGLAIGPGSRMMWRDLANLPAEYQFGGAKNDGEVAVKTANRLLIAERGSTGSIAAFPPPHTFFWTRETARNLGYNWYRKDSDTSFSFGIRQSEQEEPEEYKANYPLYNARPGTMQRMPAFFYASADSGAATRDAVLAYTHGDRYRPLAGYKVMSHHSHTRLGLRIRAAGTPDLEIEDFAPLRAIGINIIGPVDNFGGVGGNLMPAKGEELIVRQLQIEGARRHSDKDFLVLPTHEVEIPVQLPAEGQSAAQSGHLHMHTDLIYSHPTYWLPRREPGEPLVTEMVPYGKVYHIGSPADLLEMTKRENIVISQPHPRTKGSTGYPEVFFKQRVDALPVFKDARFNSFGYRWGMGIDRSERRWSEIRVLSLLDETNNTFADEPAPPKYLLAIQEAHEQDLRDDTYGFSPITYVKLASVPTVDDSSPLINALLAGESFVSSGEVLMPSYSVQGTGNARKVVADLEWTFPLDFVEVVWGDGKQTDRQIISTTDLPQFGKRRFEIPFDATGKKWVRFAAWDVAGNGALSQPVKLVTSGRASTR